MQTVFRVSKSDVDDNGISRRATRRNRQLLSCLACVSRKLKCDRQHPCTSCSKRGDGASCSYSDGLRKGREVRGQGSKASEAQLRLQKLEAMVTSLMENKNATIFKPEELSVDSDATNDRLQKSPLHESNQPLAGGHIDLHGSQQNYLGATHWAAILEDIREIRETLEPDPDAQEDEEDPFPSNGPDIFLDSTHPLLQSEVLSALPPRAVADRLLSNFFNANHIQILLHATKFQREVLYTSIEICGHLLTYLEYNLFWEDPPSFSFLWISMLFSALAIGSYIDKIGRQSDNYSPEMCSRKSFLSLASRALIAGQYRKARPYSVEALLLYAYGNYMQNDDPNMNVWVIMGISARLAMRMGYHRDPSHLAGISAFEGEMRRRTFFMIENFDLLLSFQAGLPAIVHEEECDSKAPSNLFDTDFDEDCKQLPPSRPLTDPTPMLYYCCKGELMVMFRRVVLHSLSLKKTPTHEDTMKLHVGLVQVHDSVPSTFRIRPLSSSFTDQTQIILQRLYLETLYLKTLCILHRRYISQERSNPKYDSSRKTCIEAALDILRLQAELHEACQPWGQFHKDKWMLSGLTLHDFLLAAMITSLDLYESHQKPNASSHDHEITQAMKYDALKLSHNIWTTQREFSKDARRATNVLAAMLSKVPRPNVPCALNKTSHGTSFPDWASLLGASPLPTSESHRGKLCAPQGVACPELDQGTYGDTSADTMSGMASMGQLDDMVGDESDIDWSLLDQCFHGRDDTDQTLDWQILDGLGFPPIV